MRIDMLDQAVRVFTHLEEICLFLRRLHLTSAIRALAVHQLRLCEEGLARRTVHPLIISFVDISLIIQFLEYLLHLLLMILVRCTDKFVIRSIHQIPYPADLSRHMIHIFFRRNTCFLRLHLDLLSMFVCPCLKEYVVSLAPLISRDRICQDDLIGVADMGFPRRIGNRRCHIILWFFTHFPSLPSFQAYLCKKKSSRIYYEIYREDGILPCYHFFFVLPSQAEPR